MVGRPKKYGEDLVQINLWLPPGLKRRVLEHVGSGNVSRFFRDAVETALPANDAESRLKELVAVREDLVVEEERLKAEVVRRGKELRAEVERKSREVSDGKRLEECLVLQERFFGVDRELMNQAYRELKGLDLDFPGKLSELVKCERWNARAKKLFDAAGRVVE